MTAIDHVPALNGAEGSDRLPGPIGVVRSSYNEAWLDDVYAQAIGNLHGGERGAWMSDKVCRAIAAAHRGGVPRPRATRSSPLRTRRGKAWTARSVRRMVVNEGYVGTTGYPAVIDAERHERVAAAVTRMDPADLVLREIGRAEAERDEQAQALEDARARAAEWTATPELDGALDYYRELRDLIDGRIGRARAAGEVNAELRALLHGIWVDVEERVYSAGQPPERQMVVQAVARDGRLGSVTSGALLALPASLPVPALCFDDASSASPLTFV